MSSSDLPAAPDAGFTFVAAPSHPGAERLFAYWSEKCAGKAMPDRADINLADLSDIAPNLAITEPLEDGDFRIRLFGSALTQMTGEERTGMKVSEIGRSSPENAISRRWSAIQKAAISRGAPVFAVTKASSAERDHLIYHAVCLPLTHGGSEVGQILGALFTTYRQTGEAS
ncbi:PAS domain-containing protein [Pyruvatibacter mobilis]|uniref:PAS domain-containing protein n=1 Tax=Pyruvatibacter mobilis TaxID=1712261 RepID=A0A845Q8R4_9HYPH|nr:PAS domain-containing protein [Pyruvatibacter mobilis]NBG94451.1 PAS domain-containing protein [Pyruvatibacter mobilis]QJD73975.1 PAS domain-containing protein [Pyruvatibacter mobilis]GGD03056.1 hypothetical protein GCM10011587_03460 [Pyruvatibacter mobilis]